MMRNKLLAAVLISVVMLAGCGYSEENYMPADEDNGISSGKREPITDSAVGTIQPMESSTVIVSEADLQFSSVSSSSSPSAVTEEEPDFLLRNVYSEGKSYRVGISGEPDENGSYKTITLELFSGNRKIDRLEVEVPQGDRVLIMESTEENRTYGCELISNMQEFAAEEIPDIVAVDFYRESDIEIPQYERFFAVFDDKLTELDIYENGKPAKPVGTHLEMKSAGVMTQKLCVSGATEYMVVRYRYVFDTGNKRLVRSEY